jgi:glycerate dehydrogenase
MKIVVVDAFTLNPGDLSWQKIESFGDVQLFDRTTGAELVERCMDAEVILTNKVAFSRAVLEQLPNLKMIAVTATGFNIVDVEAASEKGIVVCNVPDYGTDSVAQHTFGFILEIANQVGLHTTSVHKDEWLKSKDFSYALTPLIELRDTTLGLIGLGNIGKKTAEIAKAFGMKVIYHTPSKKETTIAEYRDLESIFKESDFVSLHLPLKADNKEFVNKQLIGLMKSSAYLINTSRGALINEKDLAEALNNGILAGAALDVLSVEPPSLENPLLKAKNCIITPHNAWMSKAARIRIMEITYQNIDSFNKGNIINKVS